MSVCERKEPSTTGGPGRTSCASASPASASAVCCTSAAGTVTGAIAPISRNGVTTTAWPARGVLEQRLEHPLVVAQRRVDVDDGVDAGARVEPARRRRRFGRARGSRARRSARSARRWNGLSVSVSSASCMSRWRESSGTSFGSQGRPPGVSKSSRTCASRQKRRSRRASRRAARRLAHERRALHRHEDHVVAADSTLRAGLRACSVKVGGACATCSSTKSGSRRTTSPRRSARPRRRAAAPRDGRTRSPISSSSRLQPRSIVARRLAQHLVARHPVAEHPRRVSGRALACCPHLSECVIGV